MSSVALDAGRAAHATTTEVELRNGHRVEHSTETIDILGSPYRGHQANGEARYATIESRLQATNSDSAEVLISLRQYEYPPRPPSERRQDAASSSDGGCTPLASQEQTFGRAAGKHGSSVRDVT